MNLLSKADMLNKNKPGTYLIKQSAMRMKALNISIRELENKAGVKTHAVRNILRGKSKNPSAVNLQAIADFLGCTVKDLLDIPEALQEDDESESLDEIPIKKYVEYAKTELMPNTVRVVNTLLQQSNKEITVEQFLLYIRKVYLRSLQRNSYEVDLKFAERFKNLIG